MKRIFFHSVSVPPLTDTSEFIGAYRTLFESQQIDCTSMGNFFIGNVGFTHPIPESNHIILSEFMQTMQLIQSAVLSYGKIALDNVRVTPNLATFYFSYTG